MPIVTFAVRAREARRDPSRAGAGGRRTTIERPGSADETDPPAPAMHRAVKSHRLSSRVSADSVLCDFTRLYAGPRRPLLPVRLAYLWMTPGLDPGCRASCVHAATSPAAARTGQQTVHGCRGARTWPDERPAATPRPRPSGIRGAS